MKIQNTQKPNKKIIITTLIIVLVAVGAFGFMILNNQKNESPSKAQTTTSEKNENKTESSKDSTKEKKTEESQTKTESKPLTSNSDAPKPPEVNTSTQKTTFVVNSNFQIEDGKLRLSAIIDALYVDEGTCQFILTHSNGSQKIYDTTILPSPQHKHCSAKEIPLSELGQSGDWTFKAKYENTKLNYEGVSSDKKFKIEL